MKTIIKTTLIFFVSATFVCILSLCEAKTTKEKVEVGGDFSLTDHNGKLFKLEQLRGKLVLIFFGYTFCPDICPTELSSLASILSSLGEDADLVSALFISIDPERDTPEKLKKYVPYFSPLLVGLTGSIDDVNRVADAYHIQRRIHKYETSSEYYFVDHSANLYVVGTDGKMLHIIPFGLPTEHVLKVIKEEIKKIIKLR